MFFTALETSKFLKEVGLNWVPDEICILHFINVLRLICNLVTVDIKAREITVKGPKGTLKRSFKHLAVDISKIEEGKQLKVDLWFGTRENIAAIR